MDKTTKHDLLLLDLSIAKMECKKLLLTVVGNINSFTQEHTLSHWGVMEDTKTRIFDLINTIDKS